MKEFDALGCGRFSESVWMDLVTSGESTTPGEGAGPEPEHSMQGRESPMREAGGPGREAGGPGREAGGPVREDDTPSRTSVRALQSHMETCSRCRAEWNGFARVVGQIQGAVRPGPAARDAFVDSVLASVQRERRPAAAGRIPDGVPGFRPQPGPDRASAGRSTVAGGRAPGAGPASATGLTRGGRERRNRWWIPRTVAAAAALALVAVLGAGLWSWPWSASDQPSPSTGQALPGGLIVKAPVSTGSATVRAASLRSHGEVAAASDTADANLTSADPATGRSIRVTLGVTAATTAESDASPSGDFPPDGPEPEGSVTFP